MLYNTISSAPAYPALHTRVYVCLEADFALQFNSKFTDKFSFPVEFSKELP